MKKAGYLILTGLPVIGEVIEHAINPFWIHAGIKAIDLYPAENQKKILAYHQAHPDEVITKRLLKKILESS